ncbi:MAG: FAD-dependent oxidoreductase [Aurantimicrobium sp.]|nr:FAD-dependent oxidoreductase [Aurantimicrobium sp.]
MEISRRTVIASGVSVGLTLVLSACAPGTGSGSARHSATGTTPAGPTAFRRTSWSTDPFASGSYSYLAPSDMGTDARLVLAETTGRLHFAGEATSSAAPATTHGAYESGRRAAAELVDSTGTILVIGAGFAGLAAARTLTDAGRGVIVVEARDRTGGRAHTVTLDGIPADLGASWIHGMDDNPMVDLAAAAGVATIPFDYDNEVGGSSSAQEFVDDIFEQALDAEDPEGRALAELLPAQLSPEQQWAIAVNVGGEFAADPAQLAMAAPDEGDSLGGGDALLNLGYSQITDHLAQGLDIRLNWAVADISYDDAGVTVRSVDGQSLRADHGIVTLPVGVLHAESVSFSPALPPEKWEALGALQSGLLDKLWLVFDEVFWDPDVDVINWIDPVNPGHWPFWVNGYKIFGEPILLGFNSGDVAREFAKMSDDEVVASAMAAVKGMTE